MRCITWREEWGAGLSIKCLAEVEVRGRGLHSCNFQLNLSLV